MDDSQVIKRHRELYELLQKCTDLETYNELWKEFADLDVKYARITNKDSALLSRCSIENQYIVVK